MIVKLPLAILTLLPLSIWMVNFGCRKGRHAIERIACADSELPWLDTRLVQTCCHVVQALNQDNKNDLIRAHKHRGTVVRKFWGNAPFLREAYLLETQTLKQHKDGLRRRSSPLFRFKHGYQFKCPDVSCWLDLIKLSGGLSFLKVVLIVDGKSGEIIGCRKEMTLYATRSDDSPNCELGSDGRRGTNNLSSKPSTAGVSRMRAVCRVANPRNVARHCCGSRFAFHPEHGRVRSHWALRAGSKKAIRTFEHEDTRTQVRICCYTEDIKKHALRAIAKHEASDQALANLTYHRSHVSLSALSTQSISNGGFFGEYRVRNNSTEMSYKALSVFAHNGCKIICNILP